MGTSFPLASRMGKRPSTNAANGAAKGAKGSTELTTPKPKTIKFKHSAGDHLGIMLSNMDGVGVLIEAVEAPDICAKAGLAAGMVIVSVNDKAALTHEECMKFLGEHGDISVNYLTAVDADKLAERKSFGFSLKELLFVAVIGLVLSGGAQYYFEGIHPLITAGQRLAKLVNQDSSPPPPQSPHGGGGPFDTEKTEAREPITDPVLLEAEIGKLKTALEDFKETGIGFLQDKTIERAQKYIDGEGDPRDGIQFLKAMTQQALAMKKMTESIKNIPGMKAARDAQDWSKAAELMREHTGNKFTKMKESMEAKGAREAGVSAQFGFT